MKLTGFFKQALDHRGDDVPTIYLPPEDYAQLVSALENPPEPTQKMRDLMS